MLSYCVPGRLTIKGLAQEPVDGHEPVLRVILHHGLLEVSPVELREPEGFGDYDRVGDESSGVGS